MLIGTCVPADYASFLASVFHPVRQNWTGDVETLTGKAPRSLPLMRPITPQR